ncbi:hypothetical protein [Erythrobacter crassostreae]|uniref:Uncharacterized protein n=1 Tax=Erythrobacter crassostreae TaxID=2828328 RepID=A0A9X1F4K7_9SPHN|nr:hypothetical protein [Erythrobacter crassostrea]MBV7260127.1 hypothetical protein [Erythrobacter crassostrea]
MTVSKRTFLLWFFGGLAAFAITLYLHIPLAIDSVPGGIADHQSAPDAATVDAIQNSWRAAGLSNQAAIAMVSDLIFIGIYGVGCVLGGLYYRAKAASALRILGWLALISGAVFLVTDYGETIAQFIQLMQSAGDDGLANFASTVRPIKMFTWSSAFLAVIAALLVERFSTSDA